MIEENSFNSNDVLDEGDIASALEMEYTAKALQRHKENSAVKPHPEFDGIHCVTCGVAMTDEEKATFKHTCGNCELYCTESINGVCEDIVPLERQKLGYHICVSCQSYIEKKNKLVG